MYHYAALADPSPRAFAVPHDHCARRGAVVGTVGQSRSGVDHPYSHGEIGMTTKRRPILAHPDDLYCVAFHLLVLASYGLAFWIYLHPRQAHITGPWSLAAFVIAAALLIGWIAGMDAGINFHNHAHKPIFNYGFLNRWFGRLWTFSSGWPSYFWRHAHVVVHHPNVLNPEKDWTVPVRDANGRPEHLFKYMVVHWPWRYYKHLWSEFMHGPKARRNTAIKEFLIFLVLWSIPFWIDWKMALLLW